MVKNWCVFECEDVSVGYVLCDDAHDISVELDECGKVTGKLVTNALPLAFAMKDWSEHRIVQQEPESAERVSIRVRKFIPIFQFLGKSYEEAVALFISPKVTGSLC